MTTGVKGNPAWLEPLWERKRNETADRVRAAVARLCESGRPVTMLKRISDSVPEGEKRSFWSKVARLRREPKDRLIARLIEAEKALQEDKATANALREEVFQLSLREMTRGGRSSGTEPKP